MEQIFDPREFGAAGDGKTLDTPLMRLPKREETENGLLSA